LCKIELVKGSSWTHLRSRRSTPRLFSSVVGTDFRKQDFCNLTVAKVFFISPIIKYNILKYGKERFLKTKFYLKDSSEVLDAVESNSEGISSASAAERLEKNGKNKLVEAKKQSILHRFFK